MNNNLDDFIGFMLANDMLDDNFALKEDTFDEEESYDEPRIKTFKVSNNQLSNKKSISNNKKTKVLEKNNNPKRKR